MPPYNMYAAPFNYPMPGPYPFANPNPTLPAPTTTKLIPDFEMKKYADAIQLKTSEVDLLTEMV